MRVIIVMGYASLIDSGVFLQNLQFQTIRIKKKIYYIDHQIAFLVSPRLGALL